jgi:hypothetical protein
LTASLFHDTSKKEVLLKRRLFMDNPDALNDVRFLRDVVARTEPPRVNYYWPVTLCWGVFTSLAYLA